MTPERIVDYWRQGALEDLAAAESLVEKGHYRHGLFFAHLAIEKALKAHVAKVSGEHPPRIHDLLSLAARGGVVLSAENHAALSEFDKYNIEGRYPERLQINPDGRTARKGLQWTKQLVTELLQTL